MDGQVPLLRFDEVEKRFGGTRALGGVTLDLHAGEILALLGENGAGKSTLIKLLAGIHDLDGGRILYRGAPYRHRPVRFGERQPVAFIHQDLGLIDWMTVAENMAMALGYPRRGGRIDWRATEFAARRALALIGGDLDPTTRVRDLTRTEKSLVAIARALAVEADVLVLDEPTASLPADEVHRLFAALRPLAARGVAMIYVSHRLDEVFDLAHRVAVLRDGLLVGTRSVAATSPDELVHLIVGRALEHVASGAASRSGAPLLDVANLATAGAGPVSFTVQPGEIVGLVGLRGAGHEQIGRALFGCEPHHGRVMLDGAAPAIGTPIGAMRAGIGLIARERVAESTAAGLSIRENVFLNPAAYGRGLLQWCGRGAESRAAADIGETVGLRPNTPELVIEALSGGNQQKVVIGRWLGVTRRLLIAEDPTAGVDVGAKAEIYRLLQASLARGLGVLVVSTDFEEVARICHRALVFSRGTIIEELSGATLSIERLIHAASVKRAA